MFALKKLLAALILPPTGPILLALLGIWLARRRPRLGASLCLTSLLGLLVLSTPWAGNTLMRTLQPARAISPAELADVQAILVLGGGTYRDAPEYGEDSIAGLSLERVRYAAHLYRQRALPIMISGGAPQGGRPEAENMAVVLRRDFATPVQMLETGSRDTIENARLSAPLLKQAGITRIALVSNGWHLRRAAALFEREGIQVVPAPTVMAATAFGVADLVPGRGLFASRIAIHEWLGILVARVR